ncbi:MAG: hypothetical protein JW876_06955, partial [Candidatus Krumholzibacteriota bacterium]|nr:hypothetical protein [Candidatus Krumholzibacteriota bacterium]
MVLVTKARRIRHLAAAVVIAAGSAAALDAQTIRVRDGDYWVAPGSAVPLVLSIELDATALETDVPITGFSFGVRHDASRLSLKEDPEKSAVQPSEELLAAMGLASDEDPSGDFFLIDTEIPGQAGFIVAAILGPQDDSISLPGGSVHHLFDVEYTVLEDAAEGPSEVSVTGDLGTPPVDLVIDISGGFPTAFEGS